MITPISIDRGIFLSAKETALRPALIFFGWLGCRLLWPKPYIYTKAIRPEVDEPLMFSPISTLLRLWRGDSGCGGWAGAAATAT